MIDPVCRRSILINHIKHHPGGFHHQQIEAGCQQVENGQPDERPAETLQTSFDQTGQRLPPASLVKTLSRLHDKDGTHILPGKIVGRHGILSFGRVRYGYHAAAYPGDDAVITLLPSDDYRHFHSGERVHIRFHDLGVKTVEGCHIPHLLRCGAAS